MKKETDSSISSFCTAIYTAAAKMVPNWDSTSSYYRQNKQAHPYTHLQVDRSYIALNSETYISLRHQELRQQELRICKNIGYEFYCRGLFVVNHKSKYSCKSVIYFYLGSEIIKENCNFAYYFNKTYIKPAALEMKLLWQIGPTTNTLNVI